MQHENASKVSLEARLDYYFTVTISLNLLPLLQRILVKWYFLLSYVALVSEINLQGRLSFHEEIYEL